MYITYDDKDYFVTINGKKINGWITELVCTQCSCKQFYYEIYDAEYCPICNIWLSSQCSDLNCEYCTNRPEKPLDGINFEY